MYNQLIREISDFSEIFMLKFRDRHFGSGKLKLPDHTLNTKTANRVVMNHVSIKHLTPDVAQKSVLEIEDFLIKKNEQIYCYGSFPFQPRADMIVENHTTDQQKKIFIRFILERELLIIDIPYHVEE